MAVQRRSRSDGIAAFVAQTSALGDHLSWQYGAERMRQAAGVAKALADRIAAEPFASRATRRKLITQLDTLIQDFNQWERNVTAGRITRP